LDYLAVSFVPFWYFFVLLGPGALQAQSAARPPHHAAHERRSAGNPQKQASDTFVVPPVKPATISMDGKLLTIHAENSDLSQILQDVARDSGMAIEGSFQHDRVYGTYGPAEPSAVLSELLNGMGYNVMIVGGSGDNALKRLILTSRTGAASPPSGMAASLAQHAAAAAETEAAAEVTTSDLGPGAIAHPPPEPQQTDQQRIQQNMQNMMRRHAQSQTDPQ
jgi:hypothetical protein